MWGQGCSYLGTRLLLFGDKAAINWGQGYCLGEKAAVIWGQSCWYFRTRLLYLRAMLLYLRTRLLFFGDKAAVN